MRIDSTGCKIACVKPNNARRVRRLVCAGGAALAVVILLELGLRVIFKDHYNGLGPPGLETWLEKFGSLNSLGHRDHEFSVAKSADVFRVLVVGDSYTFGEGVERIDDLYPEILERELNAHAAAGGRPRYEVLNVSGVYWEVDDYLDAISDPGLSYGPDLIVVGMYINDIEDRSIPRPVIETLPERLVNWHWRLQRLSHKSYLYWYSVIPYSQRKHKEFWFDFVEGYVDPESSHWKRFEGYYASIVRLARRNGVPLVVAVFPYLVDLDDSHRFISTYERLADFARANGASAIDFFPVLREYDLSQLRAGMTRWLPSEVAHQIIAEELYRHLERHELVPTRPRETPATPAADRAQATESNRPQ